MYFFFHGKTIHHLQYLLGYGITAPPTFFFKYYSIIVSYVSPIIVSSESPKNNLVVLFPPAEIVFFITCNLYKHIKSFEFGFSFKLALPPASYQKSKFPGMHSSVSLWKSGIYLFLKTIFYETINKKRYIIISSHGPG